MTTPTLDSEPLLMQEYASALLVALVRSELARRGLGPASPGALAVTEATVQLATKRDLLARTAAAHGLLPLMEVGRGLSRLPVDPVLAALTAAVDPHDAIARWQRLERFLHSRHRLVVEEAGERHLVLRHAGPEGAAPPESPEDALILGVVAELCRHSGATDLRIAVVAPGGAEHRVLEDGRFAEPPVLGPGAMGRWRMAWTVLEPVAHEHRDEVPGGDGAVRSGTVGMVTAAVGGDLGRRWSLSTLARLLALSERTLQRRLAGVGTTVPALVRSVRVTAAGRLLVETDHDLATVGFACGFPDQPHFTRLFKRQTAMTPAAYRRAFARERTPDT